GAELLGDGRDFVGCGFLLLAEEKGEDAAGLFFATVDAGHGARTVQGNAGLRAFLARLHENGGDDADFTSGLRIDVHLAEGLDHTLELGHEDLPSHGLPIFVRSTDPHYSFAGNRTGLDDEFVILPRYNCCQWLARRIIAFSGTASESFCNP